MAELMRGEWLDAQYSVLGAVLISPETAPKVVHETTEQDYTGTCLTVYKAIRSLFQSGAAVDPVSVAARLGPDYRNFLAQLMEITPTAANIDHYITICREQARMTSIRELAQKMAAADNSDQIRNLLGQANGLVVERPALKITTMADALRSFMERHTQKVEYLTWPVSQLDDRLYVELGDLVIIGGYPSAGKSAWALQCAWHWARKYKVGFFSLETSSEKLFDRQMSAIAQLSMDNIKRNTIDDDGWQRVCDMTTSILDHQLELVPAAGMTPADVRAVTMMRGYQIIFVDYLQLLQGHGENRTSQVTAISIALHTLAQSLGVTVVALSQLARQGKDQKNVAPDMSALRESGQIEQDADVIMMLSLLDKEKPAGPRELRIRKNKEGTCPNILLDFDGKHQTFSAAERTSEAVGKFINDGKRIRRQNHQAASAEQMTILPDDTPVPF